MRQLLLITLLVAAPALAQDPPAESTPAPEPTATPSSGRKPSLGGGPSTEISKGSSLADVVRRSQDDKGEKRRSLGTITNDTLKGGPATSSSKGTLNVGPKSARTPASSASSGGKTQPAATEPAPSLDLKDDKGRTQEDWKKVVKTTQDRIDKAEGETHRLENEVRKLENDFYAWGDGNYRDGVIKPTLDKAKEDLKKARLDTDQAHAAFSDLEEDARKSNTPPGWLRSK